MGCEEFFRQLLQVEIDSEDEVGTGLGGTCGNQSNFTAECIHLDLPHTVLSAQH